MLVTIVRIIAVMSQSLLKLGCGHTTYTLLAKWTCEGASWGLLGNAWEVMVLSLLSAHGQVSM